MMYSEFSNIEIFLQFVNQLTLKSKVNKQNHDNLCWPETLDCKSLWMSQSLLSVYNTEWMDVFDQLTMMKLSQQESINFYSLNIHGIKSLISEIVHRMYNKNYLIFSDFLHHFIDEENQHMRYFANFCLKYGGKIYTSALPSNFSFANDLPKHVIDFILFARILLFEELVDFYNITMANDIGLPVIVREINKMHHNDESRHIAFGRKILVYLFDQLSPDTKLQRTLELYLKKYLRFCLNCFYNPVLYKDVGIPEPLILRHKLINSAKRHEYEYFMLKRTISFFLRSGIFINDSWL